MPPLPIFEFKFDTLVFYFQGLLFLFLISCFVYIICRIVIDWIKGKNQRRKDQIRINRIKS